MKKQWKDVEEGDRVLVQVTGIFTGTAGVRWVTFEWNDQDETPVPPEAFVEVVEDK